MTRWRAVLVVTAELLLTAGVLVGLFVGYELFGTGVQTAATQRQLRQELARQWGTSPVGPLPGGALVTPVQLPTNALALLRISRLGADYAQVVVPGVDFAALRQGPGHYPGTALPGQVGNVVLSGHRTTYGAPFRHLDLLRPGDSIVLETRRYRYDYRVTGSAVVAPTDLAVVAPVPGRPGARPTQRLLTLTTCNPLYSARERLVVYARLVSATVR